MEFHDRDDIGLRTHTTRSAHDTGASDTGISFECLFNSNGVDSAACPQDDIVGAPLDPIFTLRTSCGEVSSG
jgi:hypothetical protein